MRHAHLALLAGALATPAAGAQDTRALVRYVDSVANAAVAEHRTAGVSVAVVKNGQVVLAKGYGFADLENDVPAVPIDASALARLAGEYAIGSSRLRLFVEGGRLRVQPTGAPAFDLRHVGSGRFVQDDNDDVQYEFAAGTPAPGFVRGQGANATTATRVPRRP